MADLEIAVRYKTLPVRVVYIICMMSLPVWGVLAPCAAVLTGVGAVSTLYMDSVAGSRFFSPDWLQAFVAFSLVSILGAIVTVVCADTQISLSKDGLSLPTALAPTLGFRKQIPWRAIDSVQMNGSGEAAVIRFKGVNADFKLKLAVLEKDQLEQLLLAVQLWGGDCQRNVALLELQDNLQGSEEKLSYTAMWEEELSRRFATTAFVPLAPGHTLYSGKLRVIRQLSFGGLSAIYLCQREDQDLFVLKESVIPASASEELRDKAAQMFQREATFLMKLEHPRLVRVFDHFTEDNRSYLLLQYINGQDLRQLVFQHGIQSETQVLPWAVQIGEILAYLHSQNPPVIHRDLTPDNLVLDAGQSMLPGSDDNIVLIDFGAANEFIGNATGTLVGKQCFIAPEQFRGKAVPASDIYALGGTLYFLLTGEEPDALSVSHPRTINPSVSQELDQLIAEMTALEPENRIASAADLLARLADLAPETLSGSYRQ